MPRWDLPLLAALLLACAPKAADAATESKMADFRIRGYLRYSRLLAGGAGCASSWITACAAMGPWLIRASPDAIKLEGPSTGYATLNGTMIDCPEAILDLSADARGANPEATGAFPADRVKPGLVPATLVLLVPGGNPNSLQLRTLTTQCIHEFTLTRATSFIMGVAPEEYISWLSAAGRPAPAALLAGGLAAAAMALL